MEGAWALSFVAAMIARVAFMATINPPGGFYRKGPHAGEAVFAVTDPAKFQTVMELNILAFCAFLLALILIPFSVISKSPLLNSCIYVVFMFSLANLFGSYVFSLELITGDRALFLDIVKTTGILLAIMIFLATVFSLLYGEEGRVDGGDVEGDWF